MCRNIRTLANFDPPATDDEIRASALQFVRKLSGSTKPSRANEAAFNQAVDDVTCGRRTSRALVDDPRGAAQPRGRSPQGARTRARALRRSPVTTARLRASRPHQILQALALLWISTTLGFFSSLSENDESWETVLLAALVMLALTVVLSVGLWRGRNWAGWRI
jgi:hypothetical protein